MRSATVLCFVLIYSTFAESARILGVFPVPSISHQVVFRALYTELVKRGHELVVITPDPLYRNKTSPKNLREIDIGDLYKFMMDIVKHESVQKTIKRNIIMELTELVKAESMPLLKMSLEIFNYKEVKDLINDTNQTFDLVLVEAISNSGLIFSEIYNAPVILFSSFYGLPDNLEAVGAVTRHPILYPHFFRSKFRLSNIFDKLIEVINEWKLYLYDIKYELLENEFMKSRFGNVPTIGELKKRIAMLFLNVHPIFDGNRPVPPGVVYLGAIHLQPIKNLPWDLKSYLDGSTLGVIYVSLGTNVCPSEMDDDMLNAFLDAFESLPYDILWKFDGEHLKRIPRNVKIQKWFPQRDLLVHPNIKVFITQGGLQSTDEAIDAGVPLVGIPILGDQWYNVEKYEELGIGIKVDIFTISAQDIVRAVNTVIGDNGYRENIQKLRDIIRDQPEKPLDRAVWWTEYVIRHKGSRHLLSKAADVSWSEYLMADVLITIAVILLAITLSILYFCNILFSELY